MVKNLKSIHFVGIKGVGMTPLAIIAKESGIKITGSDVKDEFITDWALKKTGITPFVGFSKDNIGNPDLVITTGAHGGFDNPEVKAAKEKGIKVLAQGEAVGFFMSDKFGISVSGSHGKTTITAMLATVLINNNLSPSYLVGTGSINRDWLPGHFGKGRFFVAEADEYANEPNYDRTPKFLYQTPQIAIINNIEFDHPDLFGSIEEVSESFLKFGQKLKDDGVLIANGDDPRIKKILPRVSAKIVTYGRGQDNDFVLSGETQDSEKTFFRVKSKNLSLGQFMLKVPGVHNALNAISVIAAAIELGITVDAIRKTLPTFLGTRRRFEFIGEKNGALFYDDYAHHPTEIKSTLQAAHSIFRKKKIICIFQPHTYSRTKALFSEFVRAFTTAGEIIITDIYPSLREEKDPSVSSQKLVNQLSKINPNTKFLANFTDVIEYVGNVIKSPESKDLVIITMGAGDIYQIWTKI